MSEEQAVAEAVPSTTESVTVDPALLNKPVIPTQTSSGSAEDENLKLKLGLANKHTKEAERRQKEAEAQLDKLTAELESIKNAQTAATQKSLEEQGQFRQLWEEAKKSVSARDAEIVELKAQLKSVTQERQQDRFAPQPSAKSIRLARSTPNRCTCCCNPNCARTTKETQ